MSYINKIQKGAQEYDINDTRIPTPVASKILGTDENGAMEWQNPPQGGGSVLYKHTLTLNNTDISEENFTLPIISTTAQQYLSRNDVASDFINVIKILNNINNENTIITDGEFIFIDTGSSSNDIRLLAIYKEDESLLPMNVYATFISDTVTTL